MSKAIMVSEKIKEQLDKLKSHPRDTYGDVVNKLIIVYGDSSYARMSKEQDKIIAKLDAEEKEKTPEQLQEEYNAETPVPDQPHSKKNSEKFLEEERHREYDRLVESGLSQAEAQGTVWLETVEPIDDPKAGAEDQAEHERQLEADAEAQAESDRLDALAEDDAQAAHEEPELVGPDEEQEIPE